MKSFKRVTSIIVAMALFFATAVPAMADTASASADNADITVPSASEMVASGEYVDGEIIVVFDDGTRNSKIKTVIEKEDAACGEISGAVDDVKLAVAEIRDDMSVEEAIVAFSAQENVLYAQPNYKYEIVADYGTNDPYNNDSSRGQWYLYNVKAREAWAAMKDVDLAPVTVAVIDSGADITHEDLKNVISDKSVRIAGAEAKPLPGDSDSHGTHVSGIIAAESDNGTGITGVASGVDNDYLELIVIDATAQDNPGEYFDTYGIVSAIDYAIGQGANVINMSLGGPGYDMVMDESVETAYESGVTVVVAAGNEGTDERVTPSDHNEVISVCNTTKRDVQFTTSYGDGGSNYGQPKDISAPGTDILSTIPGGYEQYTGTSMASPVVAAVAAMVYAVNPDLTPAQVKNILCGTARDVNRAGYDYYTGYGIVNAHDAVTAAMAAGSTAVEKIEFKENPDYTYRIDVAQREMLEVLLYPANTLAEVTWSSSDESVVTVDHKGKIYGVSAGFATVTCSAGGVSASCKVEVRGVNLPQSLSITNLDEISALTVGESADLETAVQPRNADNSQVYWKSSDMSVVTVDEMGTVTARGTGEAKILGYLYNSKYTDFESLPEGGDPLTQVINVKVYKGVESIEIVGAPSKVRLKATPQFKAEILPEEASIAEVSWYSNNRRIANINRRTGILEPVSTGRVSITAVAGNGTNTSKTILIYTTNQANKYGFTAKAAGYNSAKLTWKGIENADGYQVYRNGKLIKTLGADARAFTNKNLICGNTYKYTVRAFYDVDGKKDLCTVSAAKTVKPVPAVPVVSAKASKGKVTISWGKVNGATKYEVYKYNSNKGKYVRVATKAMTSYADKQVKKGYKYAYKVKAYRLVNGKKVYGNFSKIVRCTAK